MVVAHDFNSSIWNARQVDEVFKMSLSYVVYLKTASETVPKQYKTIFKKNDKTAKPGGGSACL